MPAESQRVIDSTNWAGLIEAVAKSQDRAAFSTLFGHFAPRVKTFMRRSGASEASADELAQETLLAVWRKAALFDPTSAGASSWIFTIARNLRIDALRRLQRLQSRYPGSYPDGQLRTLQRRLKIWRSEMARELIFDTSAELNSAVERSAPSAPSRPDTQQAAIALAAVKDKPFGAARARPSLTAAARDGARITLVGTEECLAARVEQKNGLRSIAPTATA